MLELINIGRAFGRRYVLNAITLKVGKGELLGIVGPDGAGKTTLLRILAGALLPTTGGVESEVRRDQTGYLSQHFSLYPDMTVSENLTFFARVYGLSNQGARRRGRYLLEWVGLWEFRDRLAGHLSGGMKQKLSLACALVHQADLLLLDEPTTAVDPISRREFWDLIFELVRQGTTVIVSTPYMDEADRCHRVAFLHQGQLLAVDGPQALRNRMKRTILEVTSEHFRREALERAALSLPGALSAHAFGDSVHVTLERPSYSTSPLPTAEHLQTRQVEPSLEDVYIWMLARGEGVSA